VFTAGFRGKDFRQPGGNRLDTFLDLGGDLGGPIVKDRLWFWGAAGRQSVDRLALAGGQSVSREFGANSLFGHGEFNLNNTHRLNAQLLVDNYKRVGEGASPLVGPNATWRQSGTPTLFKIGDAITIGSTLYITPFYSHFNGGFQLTPRGDDVVPHLDGNDILQGSSYRLNTSRPAQQFQIDGSIRFASGSALSHDVKFGLGFQQFGLDSTTAWPSHTFVLPGLDPLTSLLIYPLDISTSVRNHYTSLYGQDTLTKGNLTVDLGLRFDRQTGKNERSTVEANSLRPLDAPGTTYDGGKAGFDWTSVVPRIGLTYALGADRKTLLRASYSRFADQLGTATSSWLNPLASANVLTGAATRSFLDQNANSVLDPNEPAGPIVDFGPRATSDLFLEPLNEVNPDLKAPVTNELLLGVEHSLLPEFVVGLNLTYRKLSDVLDKTDLVGGLNQQPRVVTPSDYVPGAVVTGTDLTGAQFSQPTFSLNPALNLTGGQLLSNGAREQMYKGASLVFNKRLANRWMLRGNVSFSDWTWDVPSSTFSDRNALLGPQDGAPVGPESPAPNKGGVFINSPWSYSVSGLYQIAYGFDISANIYGRQGYPLPLYVPVTGGDFKTRQIQIGGFDASRLDSVRFVDFGLSKRFAVGEANRPLTFYVNVFNVLNSQPVMQRDNNLASPTKGAATEILTPRVVRLGARFEFR
jgi:hypothetical protein